MGGGWDYLDDYIELDAGDGVGGWGIGGDRGDKCNPDPVNDISINYLSWGILGARSGGNPNPDPGNDILLNYLSSSPNTVIR